MTPCWMVESAPSKARADVGHRRRVAAADPKPVPCMVIWSSTKRWLCLFVAKIRILWIWVVFPGLGCLFAKEITISYLHLICPSCSSLSVFHALSEKTTAISRFLITSKKLFLFGLGLSVFILYWISYQSQLAPNLYCQTVDESKLGYSSTANHRPEGLLKLKSATGQLGGWWSNSTHKFAHSLFLFSQTFGSNQTTKKFESLFKIDFSG